MARMTYAILSSTLLIACDFGGQGGDEGMIPASGGTGGIGGSGGYSGSGPVPVAGVAGIVVTGGVEVTPGVVGTGGIGGIGGMVVVDASVEVDAATDGSSPVTAGSDGSANSPAGPAAECVTEKWDSPDSALEFYSCVTNDSRATNLANTEPIDWDCFCNGAEQTILDTTCDDALGSACGIDPDAPKTFCRDERIGANNSTYSSGACWKADPMGWRCRCDGSPSFGALILNTSEVCENALFQTCAQPCDEPLGECAPVPNGIRDQYQCNCIYYGEIARDIVTEPWQCKDAITQACDPEVRSDNHCNNYVGYCDLKDGFLYQCHCLDGTEQTVNASAISVNDCVSALEQVCGPNEIPDGRFCTGSNPEGITTIEGGRCIHLSDNSYHCTCRTEIISDFYVPANDGWDPESTTQTAPSCEQALILGCPKLIQATPEEKRRACEIQMTCNPLIKETSCIERIRDACAFCTLEQSAAGITACDNSLYTAYESCIQHCTDLVVPPASPQQCKDVGAVLDYQNAASDCLCDVCGEMALECSVDPGCIEIVMCAGETGCTSFDCMKPETCEDLILEWGLTSSSLAIAERFNDCQAALACRELLE